MKKDQLRNRVFVALLMLLLFGSLLRINAASPRVDVHALSAAVSTPARHRRWDCRPLRPWSTRRRMGSIPLRATAPRCSLRCSWAR